MRRTSPVGDAGVAVGGGGDELDARDGVVLVVLDLVDAGAGRRCTHCVDPVGFGDQFTLVGGVVCVETHLDLGGRRRREPFVFGAAGDEQDHRSHEDEERDAQHDVVRALVFTGGRSVVDGHGELISTRGLADCLLTHKVNDYFALCLLVKKQPRRG